jgi:hypothetical protein
MTEQPKRSIHDQLSQAMPDQPELALAITEGIHEKVASHSTLWELGFHEDMMGQQILPNAKVIFYDAFGGWEIDILTPKGAIGFTIPSGDIGVKFDDEDYSHRHVVASLRYLLRDHSRDELLKFMDEAEIPRDYDIDGWAPNQGRPADWPDSEADKDQPEAR